MYANHIEIVPLEKEELAFMEKKLQKERRLYWIVIRSLVVMGIIIPILAMLVFKSLRSDEHLFLIVKDNHFPDYYYLLAAAIMVCLIFAAAYFSYWFTLRKVALDCHNREKIIERAYISRKVFMRGNQSYHFYLTSKEKMSIQVDSGDYEKYRVGDEINIEYSRYAKLYFGYF